MLVARLEVADIFPLEPKRTPESEAIDKPPEKVEVAVVVVALIAPNVPVVAERIVPVVKVVVAEELEK